MNANTRAILVAALTPLCAFAAKTPSGVEIPD